MDLKSCLIQVPSSDSLGGEIQDTHEGRNHKQLCWYSSNSGTGVCQSSSLNCTHCCDYYYNYYLYQSNSTYSQTIKRTKQEDQTQCLSVLRLNRRIWRYICRLVFTVLTYLESLPSVAYIYSRFTKTVQLTRLRLMENPITKHIMVHAISLDNSLNSK